MRKPDEASVAATKAPRVETPAELVCIALALAVLVLAIRIVSIW